MNIMFAAGRELHAQIVGCEDSVWATLKGWSFFESGGAVEPLKLDADAADVPVGDGGLGVGPLRSP